MAIKVGSSEISDIQVNLNGTLTPVNIVKIGGASTNIWQRSTEDHSNNGIWSNVKWTFIWSEDSEMFIASYDGDRYSIVFNNSYWYLGIIYSEVVYDLESVQGLKTDSEISFGNTGTLSWRAS